MNPVSEIIKSEIAEKGPISFTRFMELALYTPFLGYYEQQKQVGCRGDFYTNVSVGPLFGELLAVRFADYLVEIIRTDSARNDSSFKRESFQIMEAGAHDGRLAHDILTALRRQSPEVFSGIVYWIVEPSAQRRRWQQEMLSGFAEKVRWFDRLQDVPGVNGIIFSNELLDAMPVQRFGWDAATGNWFEWLVTFNNQQFRWERSKAPVAAETATLNFGAGLGDVLPQDFTIEQSVAAVNWWGDAARILHRGKLVAFDYGLTREEIFQPERSRGTLRAYSRHQMTDDVLNIPSEQDITAHVDFSSIEEAGEVKGLTTEGITTQSTFLAAILNDTLKNPQFGEWTAKRTRQFQTLTHPEHLGRRFRVLIQSR